MAEVLRLREAARLMGVSPGRLYHAIAAGRLTVAPGGGPGKATLVSLEAVQTFCRSEGSCVPDEAEVMGCSERLEPTARSMDMDRELETLAGQCLPQVKEQQSNYFDLFLKEELTHLVERTVGHVMDQVAERLAERFDAQRTGHSERSIERSTLAITDHKDAMLVRLRAMQAKGLPPAGDRQSLK